ncbi:MAG TPA: hypothetical protein VIS48_10515 [Candidatus Kryptonia bacterium]
MHLYVTVFADAEDIANVKLEILDNDGWVVPDANNLVEFKIEGEGRLAGTDNGNPLDLTQMKSNQRTAFNGLALAVVRSTHKAGTIRLIAGSKNLKSTVI